MLVRGSASFGVLMNPQLIRERGHRDTKPFVFRLSDGARVPVAQPDSMWMPPGIGLMIMMEKSRREARIDPLRVEAASPKKSKANGKRPR